MLRKQSQAWQSTAHAHPALSRALLQELGLGPSPQPKAQATHSSRNQPCPGAPDCRQAAAPTTQSADVRQYLRSSDTWATGDAQSRVVRATPTSGSSLLMRLTTPGKHSFASTPTTVGTSTTWKVEIARPCSKRASGCLLAQSCASCACYERYTAGRLGPKNAERSNTECIFLSFEILQKSFVVASIPDYG